MKKTFILIGSFVLMLLSIWTVVLLMIDYSKIESEIRTIIHTDNSSNNLIQSITIKKFPLPQIILKGVILEGFNIGDVTLKFNLKSLFLNKPEIAKISIIEPGFYLDLYVNYVNNIPVSCNATGRITDIYQLISNYVNLPKQTKVIFSDKPADITFDLNYSNFVLNFSNIKISSDKTEASGEGDFSLKEGDLNHLKLNFSRIAIYEDVLEDTIISISFNNQKLYLDQFLGAIGSGGEFSLSGNFETQDNIPMFLGNMDIKHNNVNDLLVKLNLPHLASSISDVGDLSAKVRINPIEFSAKDIIMKLGAIEITGDSSIKIIGSQPRISSKINISGFNDTKEMPIFSSMIKYFVSLKDGMKEESYVTKFIPLREITSIGSFKTRLDKPIVLGKEADFIELSGNFSSGKLSLDSFEYKAGDTNILGDLELTTTVLMPSLRFNITSGNASTDFITIQNILDFSKKLDSNYDFNKAKLAININIDSLMNNNTEYQNIKITAYNQGNVLIIPNATMMIGDSSVILNGNISISTLNFNFGYAYNSMNISDATSLIVSGLDVNGVISSNGIISSHGTSIEELLYNLSIKSKFLADSITIGGYDIDGVINKINTPTYVFDNTEDSQNEKVEILNLRPLEQDMVKATSAGQTVISKVGGHIKMDLGKIIIDNVEFATTNAKGVLNMSYNIYNQELYLQSDFNFPLLLSGNNNTLGEFSLILENRDNLFQKFVDISGLLSSLKRRPSLQYKPLLNEFDKIDR